MSNTQYGIASESSTEIEPLDDVSRRQAETILRDSQNAWPDTYLVQRNGRDWQRADIDKES
jgi:hypothetical protein